MRLKSCPADAAASANITRRIEELGDWRGVPVWSDDGGVCTGESYKQVVKLTFYRGASINDPRKLFNSSLDGNVRRAIDIREGGEDQ